MLLNRLVEYAHQHGDSSRPFHTDRDCHWQLDIRTRNGEVVDATLIRLREEGDTDGKRGVAHLVPDINRTSGVEPLLAVDDVQYVLGWADQDENKKDKNTKRVGECHEAFVALISRWAESPEAVDDPIPAALAQFYRTDGLRHLTRPEDITAKQRVLVAVDEVPAFDAASAVPFWLTEVARRKGSGKHGLCLVCGNTNHLLDTVPSSVPGHLVPGAASSGASLVSINKPVFGYDLTTQLEHVPICVHCCDALATGLVKTLSSTNTFTHREQNSRTAWWLVDAQIDDPMSQLDDPDEDTVRELLHSIWHNEDVAPTDGLDDTGLGLFCALVVSGNRSRVMVLDWIEMPLITLRDNIRTWFQDHQIQPQRPGGKAIHGLTAFAEALGRWEPQRQRYAPFEARNADRPRDVALDLQRSAFRKAPLAPSLRAHLVHRICADGHVDDCRAALIRLALNRRQRYEEIPPVPPGLDPHCEEPAYLAGRLFAVLTELQKAANSDQKKKGETGSDTNGAEQPRLNTTYSDRFFAGAARNPRAALVSGRMDAKAWFSKLRRGGHVGLAVHFETKLTAIYTMVDAANGLPATNNLRQQEQFILGYHHQRGARTTTDDAAEPDELTDAQPSA